MLSKNDIQVLRGMFEENNHDGILPQIEEHRIDITQLKLVTGIA